jgi:hypothetical protein
MSGQRYPVGDDEFTTAHRDHGFPWCDTCKGPAVFNERDGLCHSTPDHPFGVPEHLDTTGHEVTASEWWLA